MFQYTRLVGDRAHVTGTDANGVTGATTVNTSEWDTVCANSNFKQAESDFDAAVQEFFAPLTEAAEKIGKKLEKADDPMSYIVEDEGTEAVSGVAPKVHRLSRDSVILRMIDAGDVARLVWVNDELEILEVVAGTQPAPTKVTKRGSKKP
jgi:hypothetical protein